MSAQTRRPIRICFVAPNALPLLVPACVEGHPFGGAEVQQAAIGRGLAARGFNVSFVTHAPPGRAPRATDGMRIIAALRTGRGVRGLRYLYPRSWTLWQAMRHADADVYYQRSASDLTAHVVAFCRTHGRRSVFAVANDRDVDPRRMRDKPLLDRALSRWGIRRADYVIAQTRDQQRELQRSFGRRGRLIRSLLNFGLGQHSRSTRREVLFAGNLSPKKRPELFVALAQRLPRLPFVMAGAEDDSRTARRLRREAAGVPNLRIAGWLDRAELRELYGRALALVNTSSNEGFPNTFLEAWAHEVPVLSLGCDPDRLLSRGGLGIVCAGLAELAARLVRLAEEPHRAAAIGRKGRQHVLAHHGPHAVLNRYAELFERIAGEGRQGNARPAQAIANPERAS